MSSPRIIRPARRMGIIVSMFVVASTVMALPARAQSLSKGTTAARVPNLGSVTGYLSWTKGEISLPAKVSAKGVGSPSIKEQINLKVNIVGKAITFGGTESEELTSISGVEVTYGDISTSGDRFLVRYKATGLPLGKLLKITTAPMAGGRPAHGKFVPSLIWNNGNPKPEPSVFSCQLGKLQAYSNLSFRPASP